MPATIATKITALSSAPPSFCPAESPACNGKAQAQVSEASPCLPRKRVAAWLDSGMPRQGRGSWVSLLQGTVSCQQLLSQVHAAVCSQCACMCTCLTTFLCCKHNPGGNCSSRLLWL
jgi:hypothetical protein